VGGHERVASILLSRGLLKGGAGIGKAREDRPSRRPEIALSPDARLVTIDDGHLFLVTSAGESAQTISEFLN
jgi:hypothetical protein